MEWDRTYDGVGNLTVETTLLGAGLQEHLTRRVSVKYTSTVGHGTELKA
jgi:hypothetical protein